MFRNFGNRSNQQGFTLLEITIVFALIALFSTYMLGTVILTSQRRARDTHRKADLANIGRAMELYFNDYNHFPYADGGQIAGCGEDADQACTWGEPWVGANNTTYMNLLPAERQTSGTYYYRTDADGTGWELYARLEIEDDPAVEEFEYNCGTGECNYRVAGGRSI